MVHGKLGPETNFFEFNGTALLKSARFLLKFSTNARFKEILTIVKCIHEDPQWVGSSQLEINGAKLD